MPTTTLTGPRTMELLGLFTDPALAALFPFPEAVGDLRRILADENIDYLAVAGRSARPECFMFICSGSPSFEADCLLVEGGRQELTDFIPRLALLAQAAERLNADPEATVLMSKRWFARARRLERAAAALGEV